MELLPEGNYGWSFVLLLVEKTRGLLDLDVATDHRQSLPAFMFSYKSHPQLWKNTQTLLLRPKCQVADIVVFYLRKMMMNSCSI